MSETILSATLQPTGSVAHTPGRPSREALLTVASVLTLLLLWYAASWLLPASIMPAPHTVLKEIGSLLGTQELWSDISVTLGRILLSFVVGMSAAIALGFAMAVSPAAGAFFRVWIVCGITVPSIVSILTIYLIIGMNDRAAVVGAAFTVIPFLAINIREGVKGVDTRLLKMAKVFRAGRWHTLRMVMVPQVAPMLLASARFGLGLVWKMVLFVELLGRSDGVGYRIEQNFQLFDMTRVLAYALSFLVVMLVIEVAVFGVVERRIFKWRKG